MDDHPLTSGVICSLSDKQVTNTDSVVLSQGFNKVVLLLSYFSLLKKELCGGGTASGYHLQLDTLFRVFYQEEVAAATERWASLQLGLGASDYGAPGVLHIWTEALKSDQMRSATPAPLPAQLSHLWVHQPLVNVGTWVAWAGDQLLSAQLEPDSVPPAEYLSSNKSVCLPSPWPTHMTATLDGQRL